MLVDRIASGQWRPGTAIPNEIQLSRELGVSVGTVRKSLDCMESEHLVSRKQGRGTFVNDQTSESFAHRFNNLRNSDGQHVVGEMQNLDLARTVADDTEIRRLHLRDGEPVLRVTRLRRRKSPFMFERVALPLSRFPGLTEASTISDRIVKLAQEHGMLLGRAEERVSAAAAPQDVANALELPESTAVLKLDRVVYAIDGRPVEWRIAFCNLESDKHYVVESA